MGQPAMRILVACEFSARVRDAFRAKGHDAWSCDLLPTEGDPRWHIEGDVILYLDEGWDLMIAHPPCTYLCSSGINWNSRIPGRSEKTKQAIEFFRQLLEAPIDRIAIENPIGVISSHIRKPDQIIQPWMFGEPEQKTTALWLKNLPKLRSTKVLQKPKCGYWNNQTRSGQNKLGPSKDRWKKRSLTYIGISKAMASQWGNQLPGDQK